MTRYYFHIRREGRLIPDDEGMEFDDIAAAMEEAVSSARDMASEALKSGHPIDGDQVEGTDGHGKVLFAVPVRAVLE